MAGFDTARRGRATAGTAPIALGFVGLAVALAVASVHAQTPDAVPDPASTEALIAAAPFPVVAWTAAERERIRPVLATPTQFDAAQAFEARPGGAATTYAVPDHNAFSQPSGNMSFERQLDFRVGNGLFKKVWVSAPSSTQASDGLGPLYNARSCQRCHLKDGPGHPPAGPDDTAVSMVMKLTTPLEAVDEGDGGDGERPLDALFAVTPEPTYGGQLQDFALPGHGAEGRFLIEYDEIEVALAGGERATLLSPRYRIVDLRYGPLSPDVMLSPRVAPAMIGLGLLEAIPTERLLTLSDPNDGDGDGVSGRARLVFSLALGRPAVGRFGWKNGTATLTDQSAAAFATDMGLSTPLHPDGWGDCTERQAACRAAPHGDQTEHDGAEVSHEALALVVFYARNLAVPARRDVDDPEVLRGKAVFHQVGCASCHTPSHVTHRLVVGADGREPEQSFQLIWPYTDLLLHDLGPGLADGGPETDLRLGIETGVRGGASAQEWRTAPLWGIGLRPTVSEHARYLHDGRARTLLEAVLWHGGEAQAARDRVVALAPTDRAALIRFLESL